MNVLQCYFIALLGATVINTVVALAIYAKRLSDHIAQAFVSIQIAGAFSGAAIALFVFLLLQNIF